MVEEPTAFTDEVQVKKFEDIFYLFEVLFDECEFFRKKITMPSRKCENCPFFFDECGKNYVHVV